MGGGVLRDYFFEGFLLPLGACDESVEVVDVGEVMFAVVVVEVFRGDLMGEAVFIVGEGG